MIAAGLVCLGFAFAFMQAVPGWGWWWIAVAVTAGVLGLLWLAVGIEARSRFMGGTVLLIVSAMGGYGAIFGLTTQAVVLVRGGRGAVLIRLGGVVAMGLIGAILVRAI